MQRKLGFVVWAGLILLAISSTEAGQSEIQPRPEAVPAYQPKHYPFDGGEKALYKATWNGVPVATAEILTTPQMIEGKKFYNIRVEAKTSKVLDWMWKMRDTITSIVEAKGLAPYRYTFNQRENRKVVDTEARFDSSAKKWIVHRDERRKVKNYEFDQPPNLVDPITAVYLARSQDLKVGDHLYFNVFGGKNRYWLDLEVERRETVQTSSGSVDAFKIVPRIRNIAKQGYAKTLNEAAIWISADERRVPVLLSSKVSFGTVYIEKVEGDAAIQASQGQSNDQEG
jgi:Protein of unknown function (DUF3108)